jgi:maltose-binding protein MalE
MRIITLTAILCLVIISGCTTKDQETEKVIKRSEVKLEKITASGYGESKEKAVEDAKNDALRQFGFNIVETEGKPRLDYAGKIVNFEIIQDHSEPLNNGMWWEIKIQAEIEKL